MTNNDAYLEYVLSNRRMPAPSVTRDRGRRRRTVWARAQKALSAR